MKPLRASFEPRFALQPDAVPVPPLTAPTVANRLSLVYTAFSELILLAGVLGTLLMVFGRRSSPSIRRVGLLSLGAIAFLTVIRFSGTAAAFYNQTRALTQALLIFALPIGWLVQRVAVRLGRWQWPVRPAVAILIALIFVDQTGAAAIVIGGGTSFNLSQRGEDYERQYMTPAELAGARWVERAGAGGIIQSDRYGQLRINATDGLGILTNLTPETLDRNAWVYADHTNVVLGRARGQVGVTAATYAWPGKFLTDYFDTVYVNSDSRVYHRGG